MNPHQFNVSYRGLASATILLVLAASLTLIPLVGRAEAYSGNSNLYVYNSTCSGASTNGLELEDHVTTDYSEYAANGDGGQWGWQIEVFTAQNKPAYQAITNVQNYELQNYFLEILTSGGYVSGGTVTPSSTYYPGDTNTYVVSTENIDGSGYVTQFNWEVYVGGTYQNTWSISVSATYQAQPIADQSVIVGQDKHSNFYAGAGYIHYQGSSVASTTYGGCTGIDWITLENSNMEYASSLSSCNVGDTICYQDYNAPSGTWTTSYFTNPNNSNDPWNSQSLSSSSVQTGDLSPSCPAEVSVQVSGSTSNDPFTRDFSLNFTGSLGTITLYHDDVVYSSFSLNTTVPQTYLNMTTSDSINFRISMGAGYSWDVTATMHYLSVGSCV